MSLYSYVPVDDLKPHVAKVTLLRSAPTLAALLADPSYNPHEAGPWDASAVHDTGQRLEVRNRDSGAMVAAGVAEVDG